MCLLKWARERRRRRRERIYEGPSAEIDGGTRIRRDEDAPREIGSTELVRFHTVFSTVSFMGEDGLPEGFFTLSAERIDGGVCYSASARGGISVEIREETSSLSLLSELEALIRRENVAAHNGSFYKVSGLGDFYGAEVNAEYASGESIYCYNNQDPFLSINFMHSLIRLFGIEREDSEE